ncbi:MAG: 2-C-methyl-D-erythritol 2,4-cyclodiphosphate synthase [Candidatus Kapabacteria bacterium]|nr:2-C-methyl-D-erythritol 2,4-cyclodiphosphate synthase [Ignavibacteriota bacterium]MCW5884197.1 2-C-methyl-D-erythritol 2,4-cyclodiphosphate synthase [Candidatus Kapabacteria bacterium]
MIGFGYDVHRLESGRKLILGGILIDENFGTIAHSDGDALVHAVMDALLGAAGLGDIGEHFPDTDQRFKGADSMLMLDEVLQMITSNGLEVVNIDTLIQLEKPKLKHFKDKIKINLASRIGIDAARINIKAGTNEKMGFIGRSEGIGVFAVCQLRKI